MPRGRPATPTKIKELSGNPSKRPINKDEPKPLGRAEAPATLSAPARTIWDRLVFSMPEDVYTRCDEALLASYCEQVAIHNMAVAALRAEPMVTTGSTGQQVVSPWVKIMNEAARLIASIGARLGLDPVARQALNVQKGKTEKDEFDGLIN